MAERFLGMLADRQLDGYVILHMGEDTVWHRDAILISHRQGIWEIDHETCSVSPPVLEFDCMHTYAKNNKSCQGSLIQRCCS